MAVSDVQVLRSPGVTEDKKIRILVIGATGSGKSTFINLVTGSSLEIGHSLRPCTTTMQLGSGLKLDGHVIDLIDTPGWSNYTPDIDINNSINDFMNTHYGKGTRVHGIIYLVRVQVTRGAISGIRSLKLLNGLCQGGFKNIVIATNMWDGAPESAETYFENEPQFFKPALNMGSTMSRHDNTTISGLNIIRIILSNWPASHATSNTQNTSTLASDRKLRIPSPGPVGGSEEKMIAADGQKSQTTTLVLVPDINGTESPDAAASKKTSDLARELIAASNPGSNTPELGSIAPEILPSSKTSAPKAIQKKLSNPDDDIYKEGGGIPGRNSSRNTYKKNTQAISPATADTRSTEVSGAPAQKWHKRAKPEEQSSSWCCFQ